MNTKLTSRKPAVRAPEPSTPACAGCHPRWLRLNQLPGFMWSAIRAMGESVFSPLTRTRLDRIEVIADLGGSGPHTRQEIDDTAHRLRRASDPSRIVEYSSEEVARLLGGGVYIARAVQFETAEHSYLLVTDAMGAYVYRWPAVDTLRHAPYIGSAGKLLTGNSNEP